MLGVRATTSHFQQRLCHAASPLQVAGFDFCYDCAAEAHILSQYLTANPCRIEVDIRPLHERIARMIEDISCNISSNRSMASVIDVSARKEWFEGRRFDTTTWRLGKAGGDDDGFDDEDCGSVVDGDGYGDDDGDSDGYVYGDGYGHGHGDGDGDGYGYGDGNDNGAVDGGGCGHDDDGFHAASAWFHQPPPPTHSTTSAAACIAQLPSPNKRSCSSPQ